jgi:5'-nucleotidase
MNILLTNDDGYQAPGIQTLKTGLSESHNVYLCAPLRQMSATSHAITLFKPMQIVEAAENEFAIDGTPADCIKVALFHLYKNIRFDIVISGINDGANMGDDIFYSGTVAGAREGSMNKIFSIAASLDGWTGERNFTLPAAFVVELISKMDENILKENMVLNINFPNNNKPGGVKVTHLGERVYKDYITLSEKDGRNYVTIEGEDPGYQDWEGSDMNAVGENYISITPIANEVTDAGVRNKIQYLEKINWKNLV